MLVYGHRTVRLNTGEALRTFRQRVDQIPPAPDHDALVGLLVDWGEIASAVADALSPERDDEIEALGAWRDVSDALADAVCASWAGDHGGVAGAFDVVRARMAAVAEMPAPDYVPATTAEGFAHYALYPEQYIAAAQQFVREHRPESVLCLGLRSIGSILAHVVAAALRRHGVHADVRSVRPRGHPFDRRLQVGDGLRAVVAACGVTHVAVVDEGPGLSGSSFASAADFLLAAGYAPSRIVLFPSWSAPECALRSPRGRAAWARHARMTADFEDVWLHSGRLAGGRGHIGDDISAGQWRHRVFAARDAWPAVHPQHERRKFLMCDGPERTVLRFAGLGRRGAAMHRRALMLADAGFGAPPKGLAHGFLEQPWIAGRPLVSPTAADLRRIAAYVAYLKQAFNTGEAECVDEVRDMALTNAREALGGSSAGPIEHLARDARPFAEGRVAVDGRILPHEWIAARPRPIKVDALDHHADDFWPGCRDIAWDVAGAIVEFALVDAARDYFVGDYERRSRDRTIALRLPFYEAAYLAYRVGYAAAAADSLAGSEDGARFSRLSARYRHSLASRLACSRPASRC
jgi:hypothetical protein